MKRMTQLKLVLLAALTTSLSAALGAYIPPTPLETPANIRLLDPRDLQRTIYQMISRAAPGEEFLLAHYIYNDDASGMAVFAEALAAARRGVQVKFLVDGIGVGSSLPISREQVELADAVGLKIKVFHDKFRFLFNLKHRMHDKLIWTKDQMIIGSSGIYDMSFRGYMYENDALIRSEPLVAEGREHFYSIWNSDEVTPLEPYSHSQDGFARVLDGDVESFIQRHGTLSRAGSFRGQYPHRGEELSVRNIRYAYDGPKRVRGRTVFDQVVDLITSAESTVDIVNPYPMFVDSLKERIVALREKGVKIRIINASAENLSAEFPGTGNAYLSQLPFFAQAGLEMYEYQFSFLHAKTVVVDGKRGFLGSVNLDPLSAVKNTENGIFFEEEPGEATLISRLEREFDALKAGSRAAVKDGEVRITGRKCSGLFCGWGIFYEGLNTDFFEKRGQAGKK